MDDPRAVTIADAARGWAREMIALVHAGQPASIHIDDLLARASVVVGDDLVEASLWAFEALASMDLDLTLHVPSLVVVLDPSVTLDTDGVDWNDLPNLVPIFTPPELYLLDREARFALRSGEDYEREIQPPKLAVQVTERGALRSSFRCHRSTEDAARGWEYQRALHLELHPHTAPRRR